MNARNLHPSPRDSASGIPASRPSLGHVELGGRFAQIMRTIVDGYIDRHGDTPDNRRLGREAAYDYLGREFQRSKSAIRLYIRVYERFSTYPEAVETLTVRDVATLIGGDIPPEVVNQMIAARRAHPELTIEEIYQLVTAGRGPSIDQNADRT